MASPHPDNLKIGCKVNGEVRQDWTTSDMVFAGMAEGWRPKA
jgi:2-keto-4-pentenoate hydratase/2-oxohepta-3-ene-1,7-dioic acid hydratase in catechol pathway